jgi:hypothetical protein
MTFASVGATSPRLLSCLCPGLGSVLIWIVVALLGCFIVGRANGFEPLAAVPNWSTSFGADLSPFRNAFIVAKLRDMSIPKNILVLDFPSYLYSHIGTHQNIVSPLLWENESYPSFRRSRVGQKDGRNAQILKLKWKWIKCRTREGGTKRYSRQSCQVNRLAKNERPSISAGLHIQGVSVSEVADFKANMVAPTTKFQGLQRKNFDRNPSPFLILHHLNLSNRGVGTLLSSFSGGQSDPSSLRRGFSRIPGLAFHNVGLPLNRQQCEESGQDKGEVNPKRSLIVNVLLWGINDLYIGVNIIFTIAAWCYGCWLLLNNRRNWRGWLFVALVSLNLIRTAVGAEYDQEHSEYRQMFQHNAGNCTTKTLDEL